MFELIIVTSVLVLAFLVERVATHKSASKARRGRIAVGTEGIGFISADELDQDIENIFVVDETDHDDKPVAASAATQNHVDQNAPVKPRLKLRAAQSLETS